MNSVITKNIKYFQFYERVLNTITRSSARCIHKTPNQRVSPNHTQKRKNLDGAIKFSETEAARWDMSKIHKDRSRRPWHETLSVCLSLFVLIVYCNIREPNDSDENLFLDPKNAQEFQKFLDDLPKRKTT